MRNTSANRSFSDSLRSLYGVTRSARESAAMEYGTDTLKLNTKRVGYVALAIWVYNPEVPNSNTVSG
jgi:hypothetical protein